VALGTVPLGAQRCSSFASGGGYCYYEVCFRLLQGWLGKIECVCAQEDLTVPLHRAFDGDIIGVRKYNDLNQDSRYVNN
jgi:hypothetical protein